MSFINAPRRSTARRWLFQIHLWLGLILGPVIGVVGLTGAIVVFRYELNRLTTPGTAYEYHLDMQVTSNVFRRGHRIRVQIAGAAADSSALRYEPYTTMNVPPNESENIMWPSAPTMTGGVRS